jgi:cell division protein ZapA (FtsZ GTPase activity inhibitor)
MKNTYKLLIFGDHYSIVSDESYTHITKAAAQVDALMKEIAAKAVHVDEKRIAVLVALQLASKMLSLESNKEFTDGCHQKLIDRIEQEFLAVVRR